MWFITVMTKIEPSERGFVDAGGARTWGYYSTREAAIQAMHENVTDLWETIYDYGVIEKIDEGISSLSDEEIWFKFDRKRNGYFEIEKPECTKHITNWAVG